MHASTAPRPLGMTRQAVGLAGWIAITAAAALVGTLASLYAGDFYAQLRRPAWAPPASVFGPVWTVLYLMMAVGAWLVWREPATAARRKALVLYVVQLAVNASWTWAFFSWHRGSVALGVILVLWVLVAMTIAAFRRIRPVAGWLLVPYLLWVTFATALNFVLWQANPDILR